jgi:hypothetical protein
MANVEAVLAGLAQDVGQSSPEACLKTLDTLDYRLAEAVRADASKIFGQILCVLGRMAPYGPPDGFRKATACTVLGYVEYVRAYYAPTPERETRQARRRKLRDKAAGRTRRRPRGGHFPRTGGAPCACPLDRALGIQDDMTPTMRELAQRAATLSGSFAEGATLLGRFAGVHISESTFRRHALAAGQRAVAAQEFPAMRLLMPFFPAWLLAATTAAPPTLYIMFDGTGVPCVKKDTEGIKGKGPDGQAGTREVKVGIVGTFRRLDAKGRPVRDPACESHIVSAKTAKQFGSLLRRLANSRGYGSGFRIQIVGDGADWIANIVAKAFPGADIVFTVDFYHACEYVQTFLSRAGLGSVATRKAFKLARSVLRRFGGASVIRHLLKRHPDLEADKEAADALAYISKRQTYMEYGQYRKLGLFIGSGLVEAACRTDVARRCKQSGMHWRFHNAAAMCALVARFRSNLAAA